MEHGELPESIQVSHSLGRTSPRISRSLDGVPFFHAHGSTTYEEVQRVLVAFGNLEVRGLISNADCDFGSVPCTGPETIFF